MSSRYCPSGVGAVVRPHDRRGERAVPDGLMALATCAGASRDEIHTVGGVTERRSTYSGLIRAATSSGTCPACPEAVTSCWSQPGWWRAAVRPEDVGQPPGSWSPAPRPTDNWERAPIRPPVTLLAEYPYGVASSFRRSAPCPPQSAEGRYWTPRRASGSESC